MSMYKSAIVIIPPETVWGQIQDIRRAHDKAFVRWMPHINLIYPFYEDKGNLFELETHRIFKHLCYLKPFQVYFTKDSFGEFNHGHSSTFWLRPLISLSDETVRHEPTQKEHKAKVKKTTVKKVQPVPPIEIPDVGSRAKTGDLDLKPISLAREHQLPSIANLHDAIWCPENTLSLMSASSETGIDALRFAYWTPEEATGHGHFQPSTHPQEPARPPDCKVMGELTRMGSTDDSTGVSTDDSTQSGSSGSEPEDEDYVCSSVYPHPAIMTLQDKLQELYVDLREQSTKTPLGFQPHLTLGQWRGGNSPTEPLKAGWEDISFTVDRIHLISRRGNFDQFVIKKSVHLGTFDFESG